MSTSIRLSHAAATVFSQWWWGMGDPLYAVISRRGWSVEWVTVEASEAEKDRLIDTANEVIEDTTSPSSEHRTARLFLEQIGEPG